MLTEPLCAPARAPAQQGLTLLAQALVPSRPHHWQQYNRCMSGRPRSSVPDSLLNDSGPPAQCEGVASVIEPATRLLRACDLPEGIARDDGRGRVVAVRQFVKDWAASDALRREQMIADAPRRWRWWHRVGPRRFDIAKISAVVHSLCDRDGVELPEWVRRHRASRPVPLTDGRLKATPWTTQLMAQAPPACAAHNVWFDARSLDDYRVHGFR